jgi:hypothetical protein
VSQGWIRSRFTLCLAFMGQTLICPPVLASYLGVCRGAAIVMQMSGGMQGCQHTSSAVLWRNAPQLYNKAFSATARALLNATSLTSPSNRQNLIIRLMSLSSGLPKLRYHHRRFDLPITLYHCSDPGCSFNFSKKKITTLPHSILSTQDYTQGVSHR